MHLPGLVPAPSVTVPELERLQFETNLKCSQNAFPIERNKEETSLTRCDGYRARGGWKSSVPGGSGRKRARSSRSWRRDESSTTLIVAAGTFSPTFEPVIPPADEDELLDDE